MPVQNNNFKISALPDLAANLIQILRPTTCISLLCLQRQFTLQLCPKKELVRKTFDYYPQNDKIENSLYKFLPVQKGVFLGNYLSRS